jgi:hypothetical protein
MHAAHPVTAAFPATVLALLWLTTPATAQTPALEQSPLQQAMVPKLTGGEEVPEVNTPAYGRSTIVVAADGSVSGDVETTDIRGTMAHIHQAAAGSNGPVLVTLFKRSQTLWSVPAGTTLTAEQYQSFRAGKLYVDVHSAAHPGGQIRLQLH